MKNVISALFVVTCAFSLDAQITATLSRQSNDLPEMRIRNKSAGTVEAVAVYMGPVARSEGSIDPFILYVDTAVDLAAKPLMPNQEHTVPLFFRLPPGQRVEELFEPQIVTASIFSDGWTMGDPVLLTRLISRRSSMLLAVETAIEMLSDAGSRNILRDRLINQFKKAAEFASRWYLPQEQQVGRVVYQSVVAKLMQVPEGPAGTAFPPSDFVKQEIAALHQKRVMLSQSLPSLADKTLMVSVGTRSN